MQGGRFAPVTTIVDRLSDIERRITAACEQAGRAPSEVTLLPVSKTKPAADIREIYAAGCRQVGENKVQEAMAKAEELDDLADLRWVLIGHLQTNKIKYAVRFADEFQALDSVRVAEELDRRLQQAGRGMDVLVQVNSSGEESKFGLAPQDVPAFARELDSFSSLRVRGLMTLAAPGGSEVAAACFERVRDVQRRLRDDDRVQGSWDELSMGMSGDFETAIAHGSTVVRVGTAIFGERPTPVDRPT